MIVTKLQGGLGNQLFQWAVSKSLSVKYNTEYYFDLSYFNTPSTGLVSKWNLEIDKLNIDFKSYQFEKVNLNLVIDDFNYREIDNNSFLDGYWQSEKYFIEIENLIRDELKVSPDIHNYIINKYPVINDNTVSLHIRRGDYLNLQDYHPTQTVDYYNDAYDMINDSSINVVVLSNDINWCKENIKFNHTSYIESETNIVDLYIMSLCKHNIIANSSFSWWGAWLNKNIDKKVIAPVNWFGEKSNLYTGDIIPKNWIKL